MVMTLESEPEYEETIPAIDFGKYKGTAWGGGGACQRL
jgi:hypothetical protein